MSVEYLKITKYMYNLKPYFLIFENKLSNLPTMVEKKLFFNSFFSISLHYDRIKYCNKHTFNTKEM